MKYIHTDTDSLAYGQEVKPIPSSETTPKGKLFTTVKIRIVAETWKGCRTWPCVLRLGANTNCKKDDDKNIYEKMM